MPAVTRLGDASTGHGCFPSKVNLAGSSNVFINGIACHRIGDAWMTHGCGTCTPHGSVTASGSGSVFVNGRAIARIGDGLTCGDTIAAGSGNVFAG
tara:strand:+ start:124 stop:411 length:288 start_codon:yes stop_codon:yes gene_type:complete